MDIQELRNRIDRVDDDLAKFRRACVDLIGHIEHVREHRHEEREESVAERLALHPVRRVLPPGEALLPAQRSEELPTVAVAVAKALVAEAHGENQRQGAECRDCRRRDL